jgi:hypothetical protein
MSDIAIGVPMFEREQALAQLLDSVPPYVETVYVADNGEKDYRSVYAGPHDFEIDVSFLPYDCGIAKCRQKIVEECTEPYLWVGDNDMEFTAETDLKTLKAILEANPDLGGVSGWLLEGNTVRAGARNLELHNGTAIKEAVDAPDIESNPYPFARFDFIPQAGLFRTEIYEDYSYDPELRNTEHLDFFIGHQQTQWDFASTPAVLIKHNRDIDPEYRETRGKDHTDFDRTKEKWGIEATAPGCRPDWGYVRGRTIPQQCFDVVKRVTPPSVWLPIKRGAKKVGLQ